MKSACILFSLFIGLAFTGRGGNQLESIPGFSLYNTVQRPGLKDGEAQINLHFNGNFARIPPGYQSVVYYSVNEVNDTMFVGSDLSHTLTLKAGKTVFKFWPGPGYNEVITDSVEIGNQTVSEAIVSFTSRHQVIEVSKPVIYLQSPVERNFTLRVNPPNGFRFTYPPYSGQWQGTVYPNGTIQIGEASYPYLFWDSKQEFQFKKHTNGYQIDQKDLVSFLEKQLSHAGLTTAEKTDFITYWGPRMAQYDTVFIQFYLQQDCDQFALINCTPQPVINRLYIGFSEWNDALIPYLLPLELPAFERTGFNLLEWGGCEFNPLIL